MIISPEFYYVLIQFYVLDGLIFLILSFNLYWICRRLIKLYINNGDLNQQVSVITINNNDEEEQNNNDVVAQQQGEQTANIAAVSSETENSV